MPVKLRLAEKVDSKSNSSVLGVVNSDPSGVQVSVPPVSEPKVWIEAGGRPKGPLVTVRLQLRMCSGFNNRPMVPFVTTVPKHRALPRRILLVNSACPPPSSRPVACRAALLSDDLLMPSPPAEKATARQDQAQRPCTGDVSFGEKALRGAGPRQGNIL